MKVIGIISKVKVDEENFELVSDLMRLIGHKDIITMCSEEIEAGGINVDEFLEEWEDKWRLVGDEIRGLYDVEYPITLDEETGEIVFFGCDICEVDCAFTNFVLRNETTDELELVIAEDLADAIIIADSILED